MDQFFRSCPKRRIIGRFTYYSPATWLPGGIFIEPMIQLECGHVDRDKGQVASVFCWQCKHGEKETSAETGSEAETETS